MIGGVIYILLMIVAVVLPIFLLTRIAISTTQTRRQLQETNQKLDAVTRELRVLGRLLRPAGEAGALETPEASAALSAGSTLALPTSTASTGPDVARAPEAAAAGPGDDIELEPVPEIVAAAREERRLEEEAEAAAETEATAEPAVEPAAEPETFPEGTLCYYCNKQLPVSRYLSQPICEGCKQNVLFKDAA